MPYKLPDLQKLIFQTVKTNYTHPWYDRTVQHADLMRQFMSGENLDDLMKKYDPTESQIMFDQSVQITHHIVKPMCSKAMAPVQKISKVNPAVDQMSYKGDEKGERANKLRDMLKTFWHDKSLDSYLGERFLNYQGLDPNAWQLVLFDNFDYRYEKPKPYIVEIPACNAIDFLFTNNELQQFTIRTPMKVHIKPKTKEEKPTTKDGKEYQIYSHTDAIVLFQVDETTYVVPVMDQITKLPYTNKDGTVTTEEFIKFDNERTFMMKTFNHKAEQVPAWRIGAIKDPYTGYQTCVSILDNGSTYLHQSIKISREWCITMAKHAFPQKYVYAPECTGAEGNPCFGGFARDGKTKCKRCKGDGVITAHTTGQDIIYIPMPDPKKQLQPFDLSKLVHYATTPIEVAKFQKEVRDELTPLFVQSVYNSERFTQTAVQTTATGDLLDLDNVYDTLNPIAEHLAVCRTRAVLIIAAYTDQAKDLIVVYKYPKDFKYKSFNALMQDMKLAKDADAASFVKQEINDDLAMILYADRPEMLKRYQGRQRFDPFEGKSNDEIARISTSGEVTRYSVILYNEFKRIVSECEFDAAKEKINFWEMTPDQQREKIDAKVDVFIKKIDEEKKATMAIAFDPKKSDPNNPAPDPGTPGGSPGDPGGDPDPNQDPNPKDPAAK